MSVTGSPVPTPPVEAVLLAGGLGTRLKPYTWVLPKPLVPIGEKPILLRLVESLRREGITRLTFCVNHMAELIRAFFGDGEAFGVEIRYSMEDRPMGTVGPLKLIRDLPEHFLVLNGDLLTDLSFPALLKAHRQGGCLLTVAAYQRTIPIDFGVMHVTDQTLVGFEEKPDLHHLVSIGAYVFDRRVLNLIPPQQPFGFDELVRRMLEEQRPVHVYRHQGYWLDVGRPQDFDQANQDVAEGRI